MPGPLIVPEFKTIEDFNAWVERLKETDIQKWTSKDWLNMYAQLDKLNPPKEDIIRSLFKLNNNYRLEEAEFRGIWNIGKEVSQQLVGKDVDLAGIAVRNEDFLQNMEKYAQITDEAVWSVSEYPNNVAKTSLGDYVQSKPKIDVQLDYSVGSGGSSAPKEIKIKINPGDYHNSKSIRVITPIHESSHQWLQLQRYAQKVNFSLGIKPVEALSDDFYRLLICNDKYYVSAADLAYLYREADVLRSSGKITKLEYMQMRQRIFNTYRFQPLEKMAELVACSTERSLRLALGQSTEYAAQAFSEYVNVAIKEAKYNPNGKIDLVYSAEKKELIDLALNTLDKETKAAIDVVYDEVKGTYTLSIPKGFEASQSIQKVYEDFMFYDTTSGTRELLIKQGKIPENLADFTHVTLLNVKEGADLSNCRWCTITNCTVPENVIYSKAKGLVEFRNVGLWGKIDLKEVYNLVFNGNIAVGPDVVLPTWANFKYCDNVVFYGNHNILSQAMPKKATFIEANVSGLDVSGCESAVFEKCQGVEGAKFSRKMTFSEINVSGLDVSGCESAVFNKCQGIEGAKLSRKMIFSDVNLSALDLSGCEEVTISNTILNGTDLTKVKKLNTLGSIIIKEGTEFRAGTDLSQCKMAVIKGKNGLKGVRLPETVYFSDGTISAGMDFTGVKDLKFFGNIVVEDGVKLTGADFSACQSLVFQGKGELNNVILSANTDFSQCSHLSVTGICNFKGSSLSENVTVWNAKISAGDFTKVKNFKAGGYVIIGEGVEFRPGADFSHCSEVGIEGKFNYKNVILPQNVTFNNTTILAGTDLTKFKHLKFWGDIVIEEGAEIPSWADFSQCKKLKLEGVQNIPENLKLPEIEIEVSENCSQEVRGRIQQHNAAVRERKLATRVSETPTPTSTEGRAPSPSEGEKTTFKKEGRTPTPTEGEKPTFKKEGRVPSPTKTKGAAAVRTQGTGVAEAEATGEGAGKATAKATASAATEGATKAASKNWFLRLNTWYDSWFDKNMTRAGVALNKVAPNAVKKVDNAVGRTVEYGSKKLAKKAEAFANTKSGKAIMKAMEDAGITKAVLKAGGKSALKKLPLVCMGIGFELARESFEKGEYVRGSLEAISGTVAVVPVFGTAISLAIDASLLVADLFESVFEEPHTKTVSERYDESLEMAWNAARMETMDEIKEYFDAIRIEELTDPTIMPRDAIYESIRADEERVIYGAAPNPEIYVETAKQEVENLINALAYERAKTVAMNHVMDDLAAKRQEELTNPAIAPRDTFYDNPSVRAAEEMRVLQAPIDPALYAQEAVKAYEEVKQVSESHSKRIDMFNWIKNSANNLQENISRLQSGEMGVSDFGNMFSGTQIFMENNMTLLDGQVNTVTSPRYTEFLPLGKPVWMSNEAYKIYEESMEKQRIWNENLKRHGGFNFVPWWRSDGKDY